MISTFTQSESLPPAQLKNEAELLGELNRGLCHAIGVSRYPNLEPEAAADKVAELSTRGPIPASEAVKEGLITGVAFKREIFKSLKDNNKKEKELKEGSDEKGNANEKKEAESKVGEEKKPEELKEETPESSEKKESARDFKVSVLVIQTLCIRSLGLLFLIIHSSPNRPSITTSESTPPLSIEISKTMRSSRSE